MVHEGEQGEEAAEENRVEREAILSRVGEELGCLTANGETVQDTRRAEQERVASGERGCEDSSVDDRGKRYMIE